MVAVEQNWFRVRFAGGEYGEPWNSLDFSTDKDAEMTIAETWSGDEVRSRFDETIAESRTIAANAGLDDLSVKADRDGNHWNLRWILVHMIEEYARHCGHADLIRESIDGDTVS